MFCSSCGRELSEDVRFCPFCGAAASTKVPAVDPAAVSAPEADLDPAPTSVPSQKPQESSVFKPTANGQPDGAQAQAEQQFSSDSTPQSQHDASAPDQPQYSQVQPSAAAYSDSVKNAKWILAGALFLIVAGIVCAFFVHLYLCAILCLAAALLALIPYAQFHAAFQKENAQLPDGPEKKLKKKLSATRLKTQNKAFGMSTAAVILAGLVLVGSLTPALLPGSRRARLLGANDKAMAVFGIGDSTDQDNGADGGDPHNTTGINVDGRSVSWANMKVDNPNLKLTDEQIAVLNYFDGDYFTFVGQGYGTKEADYDKLQRYPDIYRHAQINFVGTIRKLLDANDETYTALVYFGMIFYNEQGMPDASAYSPSSCPAFNEKGYVVIKGKQPADGRLVEGDSLVFCGRFVDTQSYTVDGTENIYPTIDVFYTYEPGFEWNIPFDLTTIEPVAKAIFGNNIKISELTDFSLLYGPLSSDGLGRGGGEDYYLVTLDNQSNANFSKFAFSRNSGWIRVADYAPGVKRDLYVAADFQHYIITVFDSNLNLMYLDYYDRDLNKIWGREFKNVDKAVLDYTADAVYLVVDNDLYTIDTKDGKDKIDPVFVGDKVKINVQPDGLFLIGKGTKDNLMKVDKKGNIIWKVSADIDVTSCGAVQVIDGNLVVELHYGETYPDGFEYLRKSKLISVNPEGQVLSEFFSYEQYDPAE